MTNFDTLNLTNSNNDDNRNFHENVDAILRSILVTRAKEGATLSEIKEDYHDIIGEPFPITSNATEYLLSIPLVTCNVDLHGTRIFNLAFGGKSNHILNMVQNQKPDKKYNLLKRNYNYNINNYNNLNNFQRYRNNTNKITDYQQHNENNLNYYNNIYHRDLKAVYGRNTLNGKDSLADSCYKTKRFYEDNCNYMQKKFIGSTETLNSVNTNNNYNYNKKSNTSSSCYSIATKTTYSNDSYPLNVEPMVGEYQLMGDDFFMHLSKTELRTLVKRGHKSIFYSGLCVSGQTISATTHNVKTTNKLKKNLVLNIGSVDILQGHFLIDIKDDFHELIKTLLLKGITPILTTLPPLANLNHRPEIRKTLENFNNFIRNSGFYYIDIWKAMVDEKGNTLFDCYQNEARYVSGSCHPHLLWNKIGRQRILKFLKNNLS